MASMELKIPEMPRPPEPASRDSAPAAPRRKESQATRDAVSGHRTDPEDTSTAQALADKMNVILDVTGRSLRYNVHEETNTITVKVVDNDTGEVIREVPQSKFLDMVANLEKLVGFVVDQKA